MEMFDDNPIIKTFQYTAYVLGAVFPKQKLWDSLVANNYIQMVSCGDPTVTGHLVSFYPFISPTHFARNFLGEQINYNPLSSIELLEKLRYSLEAGYLVYLFVDEYHIPDKWCSYIEHKLHDLLVVGEVKHGTFRLSGYCRDGRFRPSCCTENELCRAFFSSDVVFPTIPRFVAFRAQETEKLFVDLDIIEEQLEDFIRGRRSRLPRNQVLQSRIDNNIFGTRVFDFAESYFAWIPPESRRIDIRLPSLLNDHARMMHLRFKKIAPEEYPNRTEVIEHLTYTCRIAKNLTLASAMPVRKLNFACRKYLVTQCRGLKAATFRSVGEMLKLVQYCKEQNRKAR